MTDKERPAHLQVVGTRLAPPRGTETVASLLAAVPLEYDFDCIAGYRLLDFMHDQITNHGATAQGLAEEAGLPPLADIYTDWRAQHDNQK